MFKILRPLSTLLLLFLFSGCIKDRCEKTRFYTYYQPVYKTSAEVRANIKSNKPRTVENAGKLYVLGKYIFLNEIDKGVHIIDNGNPSVPKNVAFIDIPGNLDLAVKGNVLYADLYTDLVSIDISNPLAAKVVEYNEGVFPARSYGYGFGPDSSKVITDWIKRDTLVEESCHWQPIWQENFMDFSSQSGNKSVSSSPVGKGGSMARFTIVNDFMYTVSYADLNVFDISVPSKPIYKGLVKTENLQMVETIFPLGDKLFIGAQNGMNIYNISNPVKPVLAGKFAHVRSCDPVVADENYAYVTLRSGTACMGYTNQLEVLKLNHLVDPTLVKSYPMSNPHGLSKDGNLLFICDGDAGLKVFEASNVADLQPLTHIKGMSTYDIITMNGLAIVVTKDGLYQYEYASDGTMRFLSRIGVDS